MADPLHPYSTQPWMKVLCGHCGQIHSQQAPVTHQHAVTAAYRYQGGSMLHAAGRKHCPCALCCCPIYPVQEPNNGVPGDWVTGNRMLDVAVLPLIFAVLFPVLRSVLKKHVFQVITPAQQARLPATDNYGSSSGWHCWASTCPKGLAAVEAACRVLASSRHSAACNSCVTGSKQLAAVMCQFWHACGNHLAAAAAVTPHQPSQASP